MNEWIIKCDSLLKPKFLARLQCHSSFSLFSVFLGLAQENEFAASQARHACASAEPGLSARDLLLSVALHSFS